MNLGSFSISLAVKDLEASKRFYTALGFEVAGGPAPGESLPEGQDWVILKSHHAMIGLFQGMFEDNILTFNPNDVRAIQAELKARNIALTSEADPDGDGPANVMLKDPDGNLILLDQFV